MPYQIKNGIVYGSGAVSLTQAQYDALSTAEKNNGTVYYIYDSDTVMDAGDVGIDGGGTLQDLVGSVATIETSPATAAHEVGDYILWNGQLYKATSAIAVGETLTVGTNITATTVGEELSGLHLHNKTTIVNRTVAKGYSTWYYDESTFPVDGYSYFRATICIESAAVGNTVTFRKDELVLTSRNSMAYKVLASTMWNTSNVGSLQIYFDTTSGLGKFSVSAKTVDYPSIVVIEGFN